jgi:hypothetical protein
MNRIGKLTMRMTGCFLSHFVGSHPQEEGKSQHKDNGRDNKNSNH